MTKATLTKEAFNWGLQFQKFGPLSSWQEAGRRDAGEIAGTSTYRSVGSRKRKPLDLAWTFETSKSIPSDGLPPASPHLLPNHTS